jgi:hypothetical protein
MQQKITWTRFLIIGISSITILSSGSCDKGEIEAIQKAEYIYVNGTGAKLRFELYQSYNGSSIEYYINQNDSVVFLVSGSPGAFPFAENEIGNRTGDSLIIRFEDNKCFYHVRNSDSGTFGGNGVFDMTRYENYSQALINEKQYTLRYIFKHEDYIQAQTCL